MATKFILTQTAIPDYPVNTSGSTPPVSGVDNPAVGHTSIISSSDGLLYAVTHNPINQPPGTKTEGIFHKIGYEAETPAIFVQGTNLPQRIPTPGVWIPITTDLAVNQDLPARGLSYSSATGGNVVNTSGRALRVTATLTVSLSMVDSDNNSSIPIDLAIISSQTSGTAPVYSTHMYNMRVVAGTWSGADTGIFEYSARLGPGDGVHGAIRTGLSTARISSVPLVTFKVVEW